MRSAELEMPGGRQLASGAKAKFLFLALSLGSGASAQDVPAWDPSIEGLGRVMQHGVTESAKTRTSTAERRASEASRSARRICANRSAYAANLSVAKVRQLSELCARAGY